MSTQLQNPPLIEALLEIKWVLQKKGPDTFEDPGYKLASGRLFDRVKEKFGFVKNLPITFIPEELTAYAVRNQFRSEENGWPLVQIGPGVATVNIAPPYSWSKFKSSVNFFIPRLYNSYIGVVPGEPDYKLQLNSAIIRYINGIEYEWESGNTLEFLRDYLHTDIKLPSKLNAVSQETAPANLSFQIGYPVSEPKGQIIIRFSTGTVGQVKGIVLELLFHSNGNDSPQINNVELFMNWLTESHKIIEESFFSLIEGKLHSKFKGG